MEATQQASARGHRPRHAIRRGITPSVAALIAAIRRFIDGWNERCEPFSWTKDADTVLRKANRQDASVTPHQARPADRTARRKDVPAGKLQMKCASHRQARGSAHVEGGVEMFGNKKESEPLAPFDLRVLTAQHVIEGTAAGDAHLLFSDSGAGDLVELSSVTITSLDSRQSVARTCDRFVAVTNSAAILVPDADPTRMANWGSYECFTEPYKGTFHVGPYVVRGRLMSFPKGRFSENFVGVDLHVTTLLEGPECAQFDAPFAVVSYRAVLGWEAE